MDKELIGLIFWAIIIFFFSLRKQQKKVAGRPQKLPKILIPNLPQIEEAEEIPEEVWSKTPVGEEETPAQVYLPPKPVDVVEEIDVELSSAQPDLVTPLLAEEKLAREQKAAWQNRAADLRNGIIWSEILRPPLSRRRKYRKGKGNGSQEM